MPVLSSHNEKEAVNPKIIWRCTQNGRLTVTVSNIAVLQENRARAKLLKIYRISTSLTHLNLQQTQNLSFTGFVAPVETNLIC